MSGPVGYYSHEERQSYSYIEVAICEEGSCMAYIGSKCRLIEPKRPRASSTKKKGEAA